jgi:hypothetical protein
MTEIARDTVFRRLWKVSHDLPEENQVAFFDQSQSELVVVNALGGAVWELLDGQRSVGSIADILAEEVQNAPDRDAVLAQVVTFLRGLCDRQAIEVVGD